MSVRIANWTDAQQRARAMAEVPPFRNWPADTLLRLALASRVIKHRRGENIASRGERLDAVYLVVEGNVNVGFSAATGRTIVFTIHPPRERIHGIASLVDGLDMPNDVTAEEPVTVLAIPISAVRAELARSPALWEPVAQEMSARGRAFTEEVRILTFEPLLPRMARLLLALASSSGTQRGDGSVAINFRLTQERFAETLGLTRQAVTPLLRAFARDGLLLWRYGRVTLLDRPRLQALADSSLEVEPPTDQTAKHGGRHAG